MKIKLIAAVWEITMGCNMRCKHCGSSCENPLEHELNTKEALKLCDELGEMGVRWVTLSGGEPVTRDDWDKIAARLRQNNITPTLITNAWDFDDTKIERAVKAGIQTIGISLDGLQQTHDFIRRNGSYHRVMSLMDKLKGLGISVCAITTINKLNINELQEIKNTLIRKGIKRWQLQIGLPMGNMADNLELVLEPCQIDQIIDFAYDTLPEKQLYVQLAHGVGYFNKKEIEVQRKCAQANGNHWKWTGCTAGINILGILSNGDIVGCTSIRDKRFVEGNIRTATLKDIWNDENKFHWSRSLKKESLKGLCSKCAFGIECRGGCINARLAFNGDIYSENKYCSYNVKIDEASKKLARPEDPEILFNKAKQYVNTGNYQLAEILLSDYLKTNKDIKSLNLYGFVSYMLENYMNSKLANERVLREDPKNVYAIAGLGLALERLGELNGAVEFLKKAISLTNEEYMDPYYDLAIILFRHGRKDEATGILEAGRKISKQFVGKSEKLYEHIKSKA